MNGIQEEKTKVFGGPERVTECFREVEYEVTDLNMKRQGWKVCAAATIVTPIFGDGAAFKIQTMAAIGGFVGICMIRNKTDEIHYEFRRKKSGFGLSGKLYLRGG